MGMYKGFSNWNGLRFRITAAAAAAVATATTLGALALTFHSALPPVWLESSPELMVQVNACVQRVGRAARDKCKQDLVAAQSVLSPQPTRLANR